MPQLTDYLDAAEAAQLKALAVTRDATESASAAWQKLTTALVPDSLVPDSVASHITPIDFGAIYDLADSVIKGQYEIARALVRVPA